MVKRKPLAKRVIPKRLLPLRNPAAAEGPLREGAPDEVGWGRMREEGGCDIVFARFDLSFTILTQLGKYDMLMDRTKNRR